MQIAMNKLQNWAVGFVLWIGLMALGEGKVNWDEVPVILHTDALVSDFHVWDCSRNTESWPEAVIEHLVGRQGWPRGAQVHAMQLSDWNGMETGACIHPFSALTEGLAVEVSVPCWRLLHTWGLPKVNCFFPLFLHPWLLHLGLSSCAAAKDFATPLLSLYFPSHYSVTGTLTAAGFQNVYFLVPE